MNENIDLTKILEGCPEGTEFYCSVFGVVKFMRFSEDNWIIISTQLGNRYITKMGRFFKDGFSDDECIFFPSKEQRDWSKFERFWDKPKVEKFAPETFQTFDKVLCRDNKMDSWRIDFFSHWVDYSQRQVCGYFTWKQCIPYNEETKHLIGTNEDCPEYYKWWEE